MPSFDEAITRRDLDAVLDYFRSHRDSLNPQQLKALVGCWNWAFAEARAGDFAFLLLLALGRSQHDAVGPDWVSTHGPDLVEMALVAADDADGPTTVYGALLSLDPSSDLALDGWIESTSNADGYFSPDSLTIYRSMQPGDRRSLICAVAQLAGFSLSVEHYERHMALEYLVRDIRDDAQFLSTSALHLAASRLEASPGFVLPTTEEWAVIEQTLASATPNAG